MHECQYGSVVPATRTGFWQTKRGGNVERDRTHAEALVRQGWKVLVVWECETQPHGSGRFSTSSARSRQQSQTFSSVAINHDFVVESPMWGHLHPTVGLPQRPAADLFIAERCTRKAAPVDGPRSGSRPLAQAEVLRALRRVFPDPLIELAQIARTLPAGPRFDRRQFDDLNDQLDARRAVHFMLLFGSAARQHSSKRPIFSRWRRK